MAKRKVKEKEIVEFLEAAGFREVKESDKNAAWYKKASKSPSCLRTLQKEKTKN